MGLVGWGGVVTFMLTWTRSGSYATAAPLTWSRKLPSDSWSPSCSSTVQGSAKVVSFCIVFKKSASQQCLAEVVSFWLPANWMQDLWCCIGGVELPIETSYWTTPSPPSWLVHKQFGRGSIHPGTLSACRHRQQIRQHPYAQHDCVYIPAPCQASFRPFMLGLKCQPLYTLKPVRQLACKMQQSIYESHLANPREFQARPYLNMKLLRRCSAILFLLKNCAAASTEGTPGAFSWFVAKVLSGNMMVPLVELLALMLCGIDVLYGSESLTPFI